MADDSKKPTTSTADPKSSDPVPATDVKPVPNVVLHRQRVGFLGWKPDLPDVRDYRMARPRAATQLPRKGFIEDAAQHLPRLRDQGDQGACTGFATRTAMMYKRALQGEKFLELSPRFIYYNGRLVEGTASQDAGAQIRDVIKSVGKLGASSESLCPYSEKVYAQRPSAQAYQEALSDQVLQYERVPQDNNSIKHAIMLNNPIVFGFTIYESFMDDRTAGDGIMREPAGNVDGGHATTVIGFDDDFDFGWVKGGVCIANSWGEDWGAVGPTGHRGYFWMPWTLITSSDFADDLWAIDVVKN